MSLTHKEWTKVMCIRFNEMMNKQKHENKRGEANIRDHARIEKDNICEDSGFHQT